MSYWWTCGFRVRTGAAFVAEGKTNKEIAAAFGVSEKTARNQVSHLMEKLEVERRAQAAAYYVRFTDRA